MPYQVYRSSVGWTSCAMDTYRIDVPYSDTGIVRRGCEEHAIGGPSNVGVPSCVAIQVTNENARERIPYLDYGVCACLPG